MASADYYVNRPADPVTIEANIALLADKMVGDVLGGAAVSRTMKLFFHNFGPVGTANYIEQEIHRDGDFLVIGLERFAVQSIVQAQIIQIVTNLVVTAARPFFLAPMAYAVGALLGVGAAQFLWKNFINPPLLAAEAYFGTAETRIELFTGAGQASAGVTYRGGLDGVSQIDAVHYLVSYAEANATNKPDFGSHLDFRVNEATTTGYDLLHPDVLQRIATPLGVTVGQVENWSGAVTANGQSALNKDILVPHFDAFSILQTGALIALRLPDGTQTITLALPKSAILIAGESSIPSPSAPVIAAFGGESIDTFNLAAYQKAYVYGGDGGDIIRTGAGADIIWGDIANDSSTGVGDDIFAGAGNDKIFGGGGIDKIFGEGGEDFIKGDEGGDIIDGGADKDTIIGGLGKDKINGGAGDDHIIAGSDVMGENDTGENTLYGDGGEDKVYGSLGSDTLRGDADNDYLDGAPGDDRALYDDATGPQTLELSSGGAPPEGFFAFGPGAFFTIKRGSETDVLHSIENIRLSAKADTLNIAANTDLSSLKEIDAGGQEEGANDTLDLHLLGNGVRYEGGKLEGYDIEFKNFEKIVGTELADTLKIANGDSGITIEGGGAKDIVSYKENTFGLTLDFREVGQSQFAQDGLEITRPVQVAGEGTPTPPVDHLKEIETLILTDRVDRLRVGADTLKLDLTIDMGDSNRQEDFKNNVDTLDLSSIESGVSYALGKVALGQAKSRTDFAQKSEKIIVKNADKIVLTSHDDVVIDAEVGNIIETGDGADKIWMTDGIGISDLSGSDTISIAGVLGLYGGLRAKWSESPYAKSWGGFAQWGVNQDGELVVKVKGIGTMYVLNWTTSGGMGTPFEQRPGHISLFEFDVGVYRLLDPDKPSNMTQMGTWDLMGAVVKTHFGVEIWKRVDPLTLDLDGDGLELTAASSIAPMFDIDGDLYAERTGWVRPDDGILVRDLDGNGKIDDVTEMFGGATSGFAALALLDGNADGKVDASDDGLVDFNGDGTIDSSDTIAALNIWRDLDQDGVTDAGELFSLTDLGIASISVTGTEQENVFASGNQIAATGTFTRTDGSTGTIADVWYSVDNINTTYAGAPIVITAQAAALPDHKGYGTLLSLREAMSLDPDFADTVELTLASFTSPGLAALRSAAMPILTGWALASPLGDGDRDAETSEPLLRQHADVHILVQDSAFGQDEVIDFAYQTSAGGISFWKLASGAAVTDAAGNGIDFPSLAQVLASPHAHGDWTVLDGDLIAFVERYIGEELPIDAVMPEGTGDISEAVALFTSILTTVNLAVVRIAVQDGPLAPYFASLEYDPVANNFHAAPNNNQELIPVFEAIFDTAKAGGLSTGWIGQWKPLLDIVIGDFVRGESYLLNTYGFLMQNILAAYENAELTLGLHGVAAALGIPDDVLVVGAGTVTGSSEADLLIGSAGNDILRGGLGPDTYIFGQVIGHDIVDDLEPAGAAHDTDALRFAQFAAADISASRENLDLILTVTATGETIRIVEQFGGIQPGLFGGDLSPDTGVAEIIFADGTVWGAAEIAEALRNPQSSSDALVGTPSMDFMDSGAGDDSMTGGEDSDFYFFARGYGHDTVEDNQSNILVDGPDMVLFGTGIALEDVTFSRDGSSSDLKINIAGAVDDLTVEGQFDAMYAGPFSQLWFDRIEVFAFEDGGYYAWHEVLEILLADAKTSDDDIIYGFAYQDLLDGGAGNDFLSGGNENDTYIFGTGYGADHIHEGADNILGGMTDTVRFAADLALEDATFERVVATDDLLITFASGETLLVEGQFHALSSGPFGTLWFDRIEAFEFLSSDETLNPEDVIERVLAAAKTSGDDTITGFFREDVLDGGAGNDTLVGAGEGDTYIFGLGYGNDTVSDEDSGIAEGDNIDKVVFNADVAPGDVAISRPAGTEDLVFTITATGETLTIQNELGKPASFINFWEVEEFRFSDGTVWTLDDIRPRLIEESQTSGDDEVIGFYTADRLDGGAGDDLLQGAGGGDTYVWGRGYDHDTIDAYIVYVTRDEPDTIEFTSDVLPEDIRISRSGEDLIFTISGTDDRLTVGAQFSGLGYWTIENFEFANGTTWTWQDVQSRLVVGTSGNDTITGFTTADFLDGGAGNDLLDGNGGGDTFVFDTGYGSDTIDAYIGQLYYDQPDTVEFGAGVTPGALTLSRTGNDLVVSINGTTDQLKILDQFGYHGWSKVENFTFTDGTSWTWQDIQLRFLIGTSGADNLVGFGTDDTLDGGAGDDLLKGGKGDDTYVFGRGYGADTINDDNFNVVGDAPDRVVFGSDIAADDLTFEHYANDLIIRIAGTADQLTIKDHFNSYYAISTFHFADGTVLDQADILDIITAGQDPTVTHYGTAASETINGSTGADTIDGLAGNDTLNGSHGDDTYLHRSGSGNDTINDWTTAASQVDTLRLVGVTTANVNLIRSGTHLLVERGDSGEKITVSDQFYDSNYGIERILFGDGTGWDRAYIAANAVTRGTASAETISGSTDPDILDGLAGDDTLNGNGGADTYLHRAGSGNDTINDWTSATGQTDTVRMLGVTAANVVLTRSGWNLIVQRSDTGETVRVNDQFYSANYGIERVLFDDGTAWDRAYIAANAVIRGTSGADTLYGTSDNDVFIGGLGNDTFRSGAGSDAYIYTSGDGNDLIDEESGSNSEVDVLRFTNINAADVSLVRSGLHVVVNVTATGHQITLDEQYWSANDNWGVDRFEFADGTAWTRAQIMQNTWRYGTSGNDSLSGWASFDNIDGAAGNDTISGNAGADKLIGGTGNDWLQGGTGDDTYVFRLGDGQDTIDEEGEDSGSADRVLFGTGISASDLQFSRSGNNLVIKINGTTDQITAVDALWSFYNNPSIARDRLEYFDLADGTRIPLADVLASLLNGTSGNDNLQGYATNDTLTGAGGNDTLSGRAGSDTYMYNVGDGNDSIDEEGDDTGSATDRVLFGTGIAPTDVTFTRSGNNLVASIAGTNQITIVDGLWSTLNNPAMARDQVEYFDFANGTRVTIDDIRASMLTGGSGNDNIVGFTTGDTLRGLGGNDSLSGRGGDDTYVFNLGDGQDTIDEEGATGASADRILFGPGIEVAHVKFVQSGNNLVAQIVGTSDQITMVDGLWSAFNNESYAPDRIEYFDFAGGTRVTLADVQLALLTGTSTNDSIAGYLSNDTLDGKAGNDTLSGGGGNDVLIGGLGVDALTGGAGSDTFSFQNLADSAPGTADTIADFAVGSDHIDVSALDANLSSGTDDAFAFVAAQTTDVVAYSLTWSQAGGNTLVRGDVDGDAVADFGVTLTGLKSLTSSDFYL